MDTHGLPCSTGLSTYLNWPRAKQVARRICRRVDCKTGKVSVEVTYVMTSLDQAPAGARKLETLWRAHWTIENKDHHVRDVTLFEDRCQTHTGTVPWAAGGPCHCGWTNIAAALRHCGASAKSLGLCRRHRVWARPCTHCEDLSESALEPESFRPQEPGTV